MSFWSFVGKLALFDMLFNAHSSDCKHRKTEYPSYTRRYDYDNDYEDCGCRSCDRAGLDSWCDTSWHDNYDSYGDLYGNDCDDDW